MNMSQIKYSIIIPHYNIPELLVRCIESIPKHDDIQIIIVDDKSPGAENYLSSYQVFNRKNLQLLLTHKRGGAGYARNEGLKYAQGKWVLFADADDFFIEGVKELLDEQYESEADIVYFNVKSVLSDDVSKPAERSNAKDKLFKEYNKTNDSALFRCQYSEPWGKMIKRDLIIKNNITFDETQVDNDHYFSVVSGCLAKKIDVINKILYVVTQRKGSLSFEYADTLDKLLIRLYVETRVQIYEREHGYNLKPMPIRDLMVLLLKKYPMVFLKKLLIINRKGISVIELLMQMFNPKYMK